MLNKATIDLFERQGFANGGVLLEADRVDELCSELDRVIDQREDGNVPQPVLLRNLSPDPEQPIWQIVNIWEASEPYRKLIQESMLVEAMLQLTGAETLRVWHDQVQYKPAEKGGRLDWHQDAPLWPILKPMTQVTAWVALDDVDESNGCMHMVPGSAGWGDQIETVRRLNEMGEFPETFNGHPVVAVPCPVERGHVHFHHALTWHASGANTSARPRRAIAIHFMTEETRYVASGKHVMQQFVEVDDGAVLEGEHFPQVWHPLPLDP